ncbi:MAG TPA: rRNA adenine N-6-methyltransferase family protein, partial [Candidatus Eisenbacteria bacterium]|nr:rRNA adenine N-6-methyltransferase family protein [Candidatus Eisenbacteria bacterium]
MAPRESEESLSEGQKLRRRLEAYGVKPRKRWGQNFLVRPAVAERIVELCHLSADRVVVEIGPGAGALTGLLGAAARRVVAVERDHGL